MIEIISVRFKSGGKEYYFNPNGAKFQMGDGVIVETNRGQEYAQCVQGNTMIDEIELTAPLRPVVRPAGPEDLITLEKIFDLAPESDVKADANGNYALTMSGEGSESSVNVENVTIEGSEIETDPSTTELNFQYVPNQNAEADVDDYTSFNVNKTDVTEDVVSLDYANVTSMSSLDLTFDGSARQLHLTEGFTVTFPEYMTIRCDGDTRFQAEGNTITFTEDVHISRGSRLSIPVSVTAIDFKQMAL